MKQTIIFLLSFFLISGTVIYQAVRHDTTLKGEGITGSELKVDTSLIATVSRVNGGRSSTISPAQLTSDQDNYNPTGFGTASHVRLSSDNGMRAITSFVAPSAVTDSYEKVLENIGSYMIYIPGEAPDGSAQNRVAVGYDYKIFPGKSAKIHYDMTSSRWRILSDYAEGVNETIAFRNSAASVTAGDHSDLQLTTIGTGTITATISTPEEVVAVSAGTLTVTITAVDNGSSVLSFKADATSSLTQSTLRATYQKVKNL